MKGGCFALLWYHFLIIRMSPRPVTVWFCHTLNFYPSSSCLSYPCLKSPTFCCHVSLFALDSLKFQGVPREESNLMIPPCGIKVPCEHMEPSCAQGSSFQHSILYEYLFFTGLLQVNNIFSDECWLPFLISHISFCLEIIKNIRSNKMSLALIVGIEY